MCLLTTQRASSNMGDIKQRFSGSLPRPRRCSSCQKMVYFSVMKCRECGLVAHKQCYSTADHQGVSAANSCSTSPGDSSVRFSTDRKDSQYSDNYRTMSDSSCDYDVPQEGDHHPAMTGLFRIVRWLSHRRKAKELSCKNNPAALEKHVKGRFGLHPKLEDKEAKKKLKALLKSTQSYQRQLYGGAAHQPLLQHYHQQQQQQVFQRQRFSSERSASASTGNRTQRRLFRSVAIRSDSTVSSSPRSSVSSCTEYATPFGTPVSYHQSSESPKTTLEGKEAAGSLETDKPNAKGVESIKSSQKEFRSDHLQLQRHRQLRRETDAHAQRTSANSLQVEGAAWKDCSTSAKSSANANTSNRGFQGLPSSVIGNKRNLDAKGHSSSSNVMSRTLRVNKTAFITKAKTLSIESREVSNDSLCATWPPAGKTAATIAEETSDEGEFVEASEDVSSPLSSECPRGEESLREWCIAFDDLEFTERVRHGRQGDIFRGRWYGEVLIYTIRESCDSDTQKRWLEEVAQMGMIRHENIVLFMGACIKPPKLAVITSMRKGPTLYEYLHLKRNRLPFHSKLNIARQIAQGMGYLHAKGITHRKLNSKNIVLESRVKLCMMDHAMADKNLDRNDRGCIPRGQLTYISPELMRTLQIDPPRIYPSAAHTQYSDIFAFGQVYVEVILEEKLMRIALYVVETAHHRPSPSGSSLLFELLAERFPFHDQHPHAVIWKVSTGKRASLEHFRFINGLKALIRKCWSQTPQNRPPFSEIVNRLQENVSNHKRHSSVPDKLQYAGHSMRRNICT